MNLVFESVPHGHIGRLSKAELALHLTTPHRRANGGWSSIATPVSAIRRWTREEMEHTHAEFHGDAEFHGVAQ